LQHLPETKKKITVSETLTASDIFASLRSCG